MSATDESLLKEARFFSANDPTSNSFIYPLPPTWWSRPYEYEWCRALASPGATVLDAACGISHPLKFFLGGHCKETYACDYDARITSWNTISEEIIQDVGAEALKLIHEHQGWSKVSYSQASITALPYERDFFDIIFCVSVLEHLSPVDQELSLKEFARTVKPGGKVALTFDYPTVNLEHLKRSVEAAGLSFANAFDLAPQADALHSEIWGKLYCFRALLTKP
ncbi:2-polyprenyl-3-methyl-5-hydroxy-6-metoxy-1,4-benzoquinol methylase [Paenibacillus endophyticus]|uniref:2-polyprenyl-3-methyl-5-hydroxy-6-metoxy-1, 4-benzoquinol methylase n=1 Tax=Paenibacillus endophyticus TaxID=1294268 RepID=A0A7W5C5G5_9BACL|nr:class I SAM-dependent methyltransferase [Paenibacillus endophyticus]MBB3151267.1 2-polyprenyl-3-methyl-5-hydroxy-6-metoxy-1,4-benzoquinol methylase [Paenibacillus endophyticus]